jgi:hypothetical protein
MYSAVMMGHSALTTSMNSTLLSCSGRELLLPARHHHREIATSQSSTAHPFTFSLASMAQAVSTTFLGILSQIKAGQQFQL